MRFAALIAVCAGLLLANASTHAALPAGSLSFVAPSGTAAPDDRIEVRMRFTLDAGSAPLDFSSDPLAGFDPADLPAEGSFWNPATQAMERSAFSTISGAFLNTSYWCTGTFTDGCGASPNYAFQFHTSNVPGAPSINFLNSFSLLPGNSYEYVFGYFQPQAAGAAEGDYLWSNTSVTLQFTGVDAAGNALTSDSTYIANSCVSFDPACSFTRTVVGVVPEPDSWALAALGLAGVGLRLRRRRA